jgi:hypothetical protein
LLRSCVNKSALTKSAGDVVTAKDAMIVQWMVRMTCAIALLFVGFAHQAPARNDDGFYPARLAEYVLPDGTLPVFCITGKAEGAHKHDKAHMQGCEACRIGASILLPVPADQKGEHLRFETTAIVPLKAEAFYRQLFPPNTGPRAPPSDPFFA